MFTLLAVLSVVVGNLIAIAQTSLLRMLAYSAIGNVGFILFGFVSGTAAGYDAALYYTFAYVMMTVAGYCGDPDRKPQWFRSRRARSLQGPAFARSAAGWPWGS